MRSIKKWGLMLVIAGVLACTGCGQNAADGDSQKVEVFTVGDESVYLNEVWVYAKTIQQEYEKNYGSGIWAVELQNEDGDTQTVETITKEDMIEEIMQVKVLVTKADSFGVALTQDETEQIKKRAEDFMAGLTDADKEETGVTQEVAEKVYQENAIAAKVYDRIMQQGNVEVSDEQCRQTKVYDLYFPTYLEQGEENFVALTEDEKATQYNTAKEAYDRIVSEEDPLNIETAAYEYGCTNSNFYTMSYDEYVDQYGQELADQIYALKDGDYLGVAESEYGYHVFQMIAITDAEATQTKKAELESEMKKEYFADVYADYLKEVDSSWKFSKNVDEDAWNRIHFTAQSTSTEEPTE